MVLVSCAFFRTTLFNFFALFCQVIADRMSEDMAHRDQAAAINHQVRVFQAPNLLLTATLKEAVSCFLFDLNVWMFEMAIDSQAVDDLLAECGRHRHC